MSTWTPFEGFEGPPPMRFFKSEEARKQIEKHNLVGESCPTPTLKTFKSHPDTTD
jgi:hypothetical protein